MFDLLLNIIFSLESIDFRANIFVFIYAFYTHRAHRCPSHVGIISSTTATAATPSSLLSTDTVSAVPPRYAANNI